MFVGALTFPGGGGRGSPRVGPERRGVSEGRAVDMKTGLGKGRFGEGVTRGGSGYLGKSEGEPKISQRAKQWVLGRFISSPPCEKTSTQTIEWANKLDAMLAESDDDEKSDAGVQEAAVDESGSLMLTKGSPLTSPYSKKP